MNESGTILDKKTRHIRWAVSYLEAVPGASRHVSVGVQNANDGVGQLFCRCNDLFSATTSRWPPSGEQLLLSRVFAPNTVTPGLVPEQMKMDTLNLIPSEIQPRLARRPVFE